MRSVFGVFWEFIEAVVFALAIFVVVYWQIAQPNQVRGQSMFPTFHDGEYILTDKLTYRFGSPKRGEVVILKSPKSPDQDFIKRIIGLPGEKIKLQDGKVYINGTELNESDYLDATVFTPQESYLLEGQEKLIDDGKYFVMGDNRTASSDSRDFGPIGLHEFIGRVIFRYWPVTKVGIITGASY